MESSEAIKPGTRGFTMLSMLAQYGDCNACQFHPTALRNEMEARGLIERFPRAGADWPRRFSIRLTQKGREALGLSRADATPEDKP